jgi:hypothetical protein
LTSLRDRDAIAIIVNASAGHGDSDADDLRAALPNAAVITVDEHGSLEQAFERACAATVLGISGGDGGTRVRVTKRPRALAVYAPAPSAR